MEKEKAKKLESIALAVYGVMRVDECSIEDVFKKFKVSDKMAEEIRPIVDKFGDTFNALFDKVDAMSDEEFEKFVERMKK